MNQTSESYANKEQLRQRALVRRLARKIDNSRDQIIFSLLLETGCSPDELVQIKPSDFEFTTCSIHLGAGNDKRRARIPLELSLQINSFMNKTGEYLLESRQSGQVTSRRIIQVVEEKTREWFKESWTVGQVRALAARRGEKAKAPAAKRAKKKTISETELAQLRAKISDEQHRIMLDVLSETGCRTEELVTIRAADAENLSRSLANDVKAYLAKHRIAPETYLFSTRQSDHPSEKRVFQILQGYAKESGVKSASPQLFRNTAIARALMSGAARKEIETKFGVKNVSLEQYDFEKITGRAAR